MAVNRDPLKRMNAVSGEVDDAYSDHKPCVLAERSRFNGASVVSIRTVEPRA